MAPNYYLHENVLEMHRLDLQREMEQRRLLAKLPRRKRGRKAVYVLGLFLVKLGMRLEQSAQQVEPARNNV
jgi:hypothetical protein